LADKLHGAGFFPVLVGTARHAMAVARIREIALVVIDAEHLPDPAMRLIRDLRNLSGTSAQARILTMGFYIPDSLRMGLTEAGADAILTMLDDDATGGAFDRLIGRS
jgi:DNA-binding response OmpR family regulator